MLARGLELPGRFRGEAGIELERLAQQQRTIVEINRAVNAHMERAKLFRAIARSLRPIVPFDRMGIGIATANEKSFASTVSRIERTRRTQGPAPATLEPGRSSRPGRTELEMKRLSSPNVQ